MAFESFDAFIAMGGHGPYVWACYIVFFALSIVLIHWSRVQRKATLKRLAHRHAGSGKGNMAGTEDIERTGRTGADFARVKSSDQITDG